MAADKRSHYAGTSEDGGLRSRSIFLTIILAPVVLPLKAAFLGLCLLTGIDCKLALDGSAREQWQIARNAVLLAIGFGLNSAGFGFLLSSGISNGDPRIVWGVAIVLALLFAVVDASGIVNGIFETGVQIVVAKKSGDDEYEPPPKRVPFFRGLLSAAGLVPTVIGICFHLLWGDLEPARERENAALNITAIQEAKAYVAEEVASATSDRDQKRRVVASLSKVDRVNDRSTAHPVLSDLFKAREELDQIKKEIVDDRALIASSEAKVSCESHGTKENGCTGQIGDKIHPELDRAKDRNAQAKTQLAGAIQRQGVVETNIATLEQSVATLSSNASIDLAAAEKTLRDVKSQSQGEKFAVIVRNQPSYNPPGESILAYGDALVYLLRSSPAACILVTLVIGCVMIIDLAVMTVGRHWSKMPVYAEAAVRKDKATMERIETGLLEDSIQYVERRDFLEETIAEFRKRRRQRRFEEAVAEASAKAHMNNVYALDGSRFTGSQK